jgi:hypothetical protein
MSKLLKNELTRCIYGQKFKILFAALLGYSLFAFLITAINIWNHTSLRLLSADQYSILLSSDLRAFLHLLLLICPIISCIIYADSYILEREKGIVNYYYTRIGFLKNIAAKLLAVILMNFFTIFIILLLNIVLIWIAIPDIGVSSQYGLPVYQYQIPGKDNLFLADVYNKNPFFYTSIIAGIIALFHAFIGACALGLSLLIKNIKRINLYIYIFVSVSILTILVPIRFELGMYAQTYPNELSDLVITCIGWILAGIVLMAGGIYFERKR